MSIYDVDYSDLGKQLKPPDKRFAKNLSWMKSLLAPLAYLHELFFTSYKVGSQAPQYAAGAYNRKDRVVYFQSVYESLVSNNTDLPTAETSWKRIQENFIGIDERVKYNGQRIILEYALNKWFATQFRQPGGALSDIYLTVNQIPSTSFIVGALADRSSVVFSHVSSDYVFNTLNINTLTNLTINMPIAVFDALGNDDIERESIVRSFVNKYITAGITYNISTY